MENPQPFFLKRFIQKELHEGFLLVLCMMAALFMANSPWQEAFSDIWKTQVSLGVGEHAWGMSFKVIIDDVLMTLFFLLIGCELKRERLEGELSTPQHIRLPFFAALGGMLVPAFLYVFFFFAMNPSSPEQEIAALRGWAVPTATDIAFALGILGFLGSRVPSSLKIFLMALAILDDLGAILLIGLFYTEQLELSGLLAMLFILACLWGLNRKGVRSLTPYLFLGVGLWIATHETGVHSTLSGVLLALFIPFRASDKEDEKRSPLKSLLHSLHPFVSYAIMPLFALANAGVSLHGASGDMFFNTITLGIILGLFLGKQLGVFAAGWMAVKMGLARLPHGTSWAHYYGIALLCGIGFTMSLFIGLLAFDDPESLANVRLGVLTGSGLSAFAGYAVLRWVAKKEV